MAMLWTSTRHCSLELKVDVVIHEDIGKDNEVMSLGGCVDSLCEKLADLVILEIGFAVEGRKGQVV